MTSISASASRHASAPTASTWQRDLILALVAALLSVAVQAANGFPTLTSPRGDNDSMLRLVEVRDLLAGQGWFDLHQYRMGAEGGFIMHWSRLVDAPIAGLILLARSLGASVATAETIASIVWPALLFCLTLFFTVRAARRFGGARAALPALVLGAMALYFLGIYSAGALDHHNIQIMLTMAGLSLLLSAPERRGAAFGAGVAVALSLAIGMETAPYVAAAGLGVAGLLAFGGDGERTVARDYGLGFAGISALVFVATVPPSGWGQPACDAYSVVQFALGTAGGLGLAVVASFEPAYRTRTRRIASLAALALVVAFVLVHFFPQCMASPYAGLDPRLKTLWLDNVDEAQSLFKLLANDPASVAARYATPLIGLVLLVSRPARAGWRREDWLVLSALLTAFLVSAWQIRGSNFSIVYAVIPLAGWVGAWRERANGSRSTAIQLRMAMAWIVSANVCWTGLAAAATVAADNGVNETGAASALGNAAMSGMADRGHCDRAADFARLSALPPTTVLAISNLGSPILLYTHHRALAGPYHRNTEGNLAVLDAFTGPPDRAKAMVDARNVGLIALCPTDPEQKLLERQAPDGFLAALERNEVPGWLEPIDTHGSLLRLYRVR
jgi:hypothetical protein